MSWTSPKEGCDGQVIACFNDPGLLAAREVARGPEIGMGEAALAVAGTIGGGFSIVSMLERCRADMIRQVQARGMAALCRPIRLVDVTVLQAEDDGAGQHPTDPALWSELEVRYAAFLVSLPEVEENGVIRRLWRELVAIAAQSDGYLRRGAF